MLDITELYQPYDNKTFADRVSCEILKAIVLDANSWLEVLHQLLVYRDDEGVPAIRKVTSYDLAVLISLVIREQIPIGDTHD